MPAPSIGSVSIPISDDEADDPVGRKKARARRKRRKQPFFPRSRGDLCPWIVRNLVRWWTLLLFLPAAALLLYEATRIAWSTPGWRPPVSKAIDNESMGGNLNRLDPTTRTVHGARERCLKVLPPEEIQLLEFPAATQLDFPVKTVLYRSQSKDLISRDNATLTQQYAQGSRFNAFTGFQTLQEREESFKVTQNPEVHCGFYSESGGFRISEDDRIYMKTCEAVISTCAFGGGDDLYQPIGMTDASLKKVCYVAFWDEITYSTQEAEGKLTDDNKMIGKWRIILVKDLPFSDQRLNGKIPKMLSHRLFRRARYSIWVDSKSQFRRDPVGVFEALLWRTNAVLAISEHGARSSIYDEAKAVVKKNKATPEEVEFQLAQYRQDRFSDIKRFNGKKALSEASIIVREHTPETNLFMCLWFNEVVRFTSRDQLSFPYVLRRLNIPGINMFPVCTRKDLVNSMGHKRKVKPLEERFHEQNH